MRISIFAALLLATTGCARVYQVSVGQAEVELFYKEAQSHGRNLRDHDLIVRPGTLSGNTVGQCQTGGVPTVTLDTTFWAQADAAEREVLVFHELGHCLLNLDHSDHLAIMWPYLLTQSFYLAHRTALVDELFSK
jgi:hypothetical protein